MMNSVLSGARIVANFNSPKMRIVITGGPSSVPIDAVRSITNHSTGELAVILAQRFRAAANEVELFLGKRSIFRIFEAQFFDTNEDLERLLSVVAKREEVGVVLHAAALADFGVDRIVIPEEAKRAAKISSSTTAVQLWLLPKSKLIAKLRQLFPQAFIVGWKFEVDGSPREAVEKAVQQIKAHRTNACIVNGTAFGSGFGYCDETGLLYSAETKDELANLLVRLLPRMD